VTGGDVAAAALQRKAIAAIVEVAGVIAPVHIISSLLCGEQKRHNPINVKFWEVIADNLSKRGWSWGCVAAVDPYGETIFIADAHRNGKRFIVRADEILTAFVELESAICPRGRAVGCSDGCQCWTAIRFTLPNSSNSHRYQLGKFCR
jgi:hypothetical protein